MKLNLVIGVLWCTFIAVESQGCSSFGEVYPQESLKKGTHNLVWSKAQIQRKAPDFQGTAVIDGQIKEIKLSQYKGKYLVFFFYPLDFTFVCPTEIIAFSDRVE